jgi:hypothetical protein
MKSRKIQILEFILDKIEGGDYEREVMCNHFGHPTKKNELVWGSPWEAAMAGVELIEGSHVELTGEGKEGEGGGRVGRRQGAWLGVAWEAARGTMGLLLPLFVRAAAAGCFVLNELDVRKERRKERRKRKEKEGKEKRKNKEKIWKIFQTWKFQRRKIKDNLWSW